MTLWDRLIHLGVGLAIGSLLLGWVQEREIRHAERAAFDRWESRVAQHVAITDEALRLALTNPTERGLAWSQAVRNVLSRAAHDPGVVDDARGKKGAGKEGGAATWGREP